MESGETATTPMQEQMTLAYLEAMRRQKVEEYRMAQLTGKTPTARAISKAPRRIFERLQQRQRQLSAQFMNGLDPLAYRRAINVPYTSSKRLYYGNA